MTPYEAWHGTKPSIAHLCVFGCLVYALVPQQHYKKLDDKVVKCIFVGYKSKSKGYIGCITHKQSVFWLAKMWCF